MRSIAGLINRNRCVAITLKGERCRKKATQGSYCTVHARLEKYRKDDDTKTDERLARIVSVGASLIVIMEKAQQYLPDLVITAMKIIDNAPMYNHREDQTPPPSVPELKKITFKENFIKDILIGKDLSDDEGGELIGYWEMNEIYPLDLSDEYKGKLPPEIWNELQEALVNWRELYRRKDGSFPLQPGD